MIFTLNSFVPSEVEFVVSVSSIFTVAVPDVTPDAASNVTIPVCPFTEITPEV